MTDALFTIAVIVAGAGGVYALFCVVAPLVSGRLSDAVGHPQTGMYDPDPDWEAKQLAADAAERGE